MASQAIDIEIAFLQAQIRRAFAMDDFGTTGKLRRELKLRLAQRERLLLPYETGKAMAMSAAAKRIGAPAGWAKSMAGSGAFADPNAPAACVQQLRSHTNIVWRCRFAPSSADAEVSSNQLIATVSDDKSVKVWSTMLARCVATLTGHKKMVTDCSIARGPAEGADVVGGRMLIASASADGTVRVWEQQRALREDDGAANAAAVDDKDAAEEEKDAQGGSSDGVGGDGVEENEMCDAHSIGIEVEEEVDPDALFHCALTLRGHRGGVKCCAFARPDAETPRLIASGGDDATVRRFVPDDCSFMMRLRILLTIGLAPPPTILNHWPGAAVAYAGRRCSQSAANAHRRCALRRVQPRRDAARLRGQRRRRASLETPGECVLYARTYVPLHTLCESCSQFDSLPYHKLD